MKNVLISILICLSASTAVFGQVQRESLNTKDNPMVNITVENVIPVEVQARFVPTANCAKYNTLMGQQAEMETWAAQTGVTIDELVTQWGYEDTQESVHNFSGLAPNTEYTIYARPFDAQGNAYPMQTTVITTGQYGGEGLSVINVEVTDITDSTVRLIANANDETAVFYDGLITTEYFEEIGADSAIQVIQSNGYPQYGSDDWIWVNLNPNTPYKAIGIGKNALEEWGDTTIVNFKTLPTHEGLQAYIFDTQTLVYPQPNNGHFTVEYATNNKRHQLRIFDINGHCVHQDIISSPKQNINAGHLSSGQYFLQIGKGQAVKTLMIVK